MTESYHGSRRAWLWLLPAGALLVVAAAVLGLGLTWPFVSALLAGFAVVSVWAIVRLQAERAEHEAAMTRRDAAEAVLAERLRLARDLHDLVSHGLGMITVRAAAAAHLHARKPDEAVLLSAIADVEAISRRATLELRRMLEALREAGDQPARHPSETLASLPEIIEGARRAGLRVALHEEELGAVSPGAQLAICRIVREGLANSARYAGSTSVDVWLARTSAAVSVTVRDDGPHRGWAVRPGAGHGLLGLRERVGSLGGTLTAGPRGGDPGFCLEAIIPESAGAGLTNGVAEVGGAGLTNGVAEVGGAGLTNGVAEVGGAGLTKGVAERGGAGLTKSVAEGGAGQTKGVAEGGGAAQTKSVEVVPEGAGAARMKALEAVVSERGGTARAKFAGSLGDEGASAAGARGYESIGSEGDSAAWRKGAGAVASEGGGVARVEDVDAVAGRADSGEVAGVEAGSGRAGSGGVAGGGR
ncbi:histidine kinase [Actinoplanes sp. NPDC026670]|uniref:histidine kinase n=1 Tax=Actinoplanes sp. NPDC026670 TaxID=3154700 RepID=UPI0033FA7BAA